MSKLTKPSSPFNGLTSAPKLVNPQKIDLDHLRPATQQKIYQSKSQQHFRPQLQTTKNVNLKADFANEQAFDSDDSNIYGNKQARPTTVDNFVPRAAFKNGGPQRSEFKIRRMASLYPTTKHGWDGKEETQNNPLENEILLATTKEDREAVEDLERWDEYKILASQKFFLLSF